MKLTAKEQKLWRQQYERAQAQRRAELTRGTVPNPMPRAPTRLRRYSAGYKWWKHD